MMDGPADPRPQDADTPTDERLHALAVLLERRIGEGTIDEAEADVLRTLLADYTAAVHNLRGDVAATAKRVDAARTAVDEVLRYLAGERARPVEAP